MREDVTIMLHAAARGDERAADRLLEAVYDELRVLAAARLRHERPDQTLSATALVHEAYLRLLGGEQGVWNGDGHFFAAAAEAMRRILIDRARARLAAKRGGGVDRVGLDGDLAASEDDPGRLVALHEALTRLEREDPAKASLVKLRYFAGLTEQQAADALGISRATAARSWAYAKAWLYEEVRRRQGLR